MTAETGEEFPSGSLRTQEGRGCEQLHQACPFSKNTAGPPTHSLDCLTFGKGLKVHFWFSSCVTGYWTGVAHLSVYHDCRLSSLSNKRHQTKTQPGKELNASSGVETTGLWEHEKIPKMLYQAPWCWQHSKPQLERWSAARAEIDGDAKMVKNGKILIWGITALLLSKSWWTGS